MRRCLALPAAMLVAIQAAALDAQPLPYPPSAPTVAPAHHLDPVGPVDLARRQAAPMPLAPPGQPGSSRARAAEHTAATPRSAAPGGAAILQVGGSLAIVVGLFLLAAWALKRGMPAGSRTLPAEVVEVLGRTPLPGRLHAHLVRCGNKLLLVAVSTSGADTLTEITDPVEVDRLAGICQQAQPHSSTGAFRQILDQFGADAAPSRRWPWTSWFALRRDDEKDTL